MDSPQPHVFEGCPDVRGHTDRSLSTWRSTIAYRTRGPATTAHTLVARSLSDSVGDCPSDPQPIPGVPGLPPLGHQVSRTGASQDRRIAGGMKSRPSGIVAFPVATLSIATTTGLVAASRAVSLGGDSTPTAGSARPGLKAAGPPRYVSRDWPNTPPELPPDHTVPMQAVHGTSDGPETTGLRPRPTVFSRSASRPSTRGTATDPGCIRRQPDPSVTSTGRVLGEVETPIGVLRGREGCTHARHLHTGTGQYHVAGCRRQPPTNHISKIRTLLCSTTLYFVALVGLCSTCSPVGRSLLP